MCRGVVKLKQRHSIAASWRGGGIELFAEERLKLGLLLATVIIVLLSASFAGGIARNCRAMKEAPASNSHNQVRAEGDLEVGEHHDECDAEDDDENFKHAAEEVARGRRRRVRFCYGL